MTKVAFLTSVHDPFDTRIFYKELKSLAEAGYEVVLIAPYGHDTVVDGIPIRAVPRKPGKLRRIFTAGWEVVSRANAEAADVYQIHDPELLLWTQILRLQGRIVIYDMHENVPQSIRHKTWIHPAMRGLFASGYRILERLLIRKMPVVFAENSYTQNYRWHRGPQATVLNMPQADQLLAVDEPPNAHPTIGYVGDVKPWRGSTVTLEALALLQAQGREVAWECVGPLSDEQRQTMTRFARDNHLKNVHLHGRLKPAEWHPIIARCHIGLAVLDTLPNYTQSYPTKLFEYMALGIPVIASGFPLYREIIEGAGCGLTVNNPNDPRELADCIVRLLDNPDEAAAMGERGRQAVRERYQWSVEGQKLTAFYERLLEPSR